MSSNRAAGAWAGTLLLLCSLAAIAQTPRALVDLSLEELSEIRITSVSKFAEPLSQAAAAIYVITSDEIRRSGASTLAEALRLAPNVEVARLNSQQYTISSRGFNSVNASNKLLVLIDGRAAYTPFFSNAYWDQQQIMLADVERIEVISGPGGTLYGANAMNGVINVITRNANATQGLLVDASAGTLMRQGAARWGGKVGPAAARVYASGFDAGHTYLANGASGNDDWHGAQAGFRTDFAGALSELAVQADVYRNVIDTPSGRRTGGNVLAFWSQRISPDSTASLQVYYDNQKRVDTGVLRGATTNFVHAIDVAAQQVIAFGPHHEMVWGIGHRAWKDEFTNTANPFVLSPPSERVNLTNIFGQDTISIGDDLKLIVGSKFEYSTFSKWAAMPNARVGWEFMPGHFAWVAVSRAVRVPSRLERDLTAPGIVNPSPDFQSEKLTAYEAGWRARLARDVSVSVNVFYNRYSDLRTTKPGAITLLPVTFGNGWEGHTYGTEAWGTYSPLPWWRLMAGIELLRKDFHLKPGEGDIAGVQTVLGHDPRHQAFLRSYFDLSHDLELSVAMRHIGALSDIGVRSYVEADARLAWHPAPNLELTLAGQNLVHRRHAEASTPPTYEIPRNAYLGVRWQY